MGVILSALCSQKQQTAKTAKVNFLLAIGGNCILTGRILSDSLNVWCAEDKLLTQILYALQ